MKHTKDLISRLREYESFLIKNIKEEGRIYYVESISGSIIASQRKTVYESSLARLYKIVPEIKPRK